MFSDISDGVFEKDSTILYPLYHLLALATNFFQCFATDSAYRFARILNNSVHISSANVWNWTQQFEDGLYWCFPIKYNSTGLWVPDHEVKKYLLNGFSTPSLVEYFETRLGSVAQVKEYLNSNLVLDNVSSFFF